MGLSLIRELLRLGLLASLCSIFRPFFEAWARALLGWTNDRDDDRMSDCFHDSEFNRKIRPTNTPPTDRSEKWTRIYVEDAQKVRRNRRHGNDGNATKPLRGREASRPTKTPLSECPTAFARLSFLVHTVGQKLILSETAAQRRSEHRT